MYSPSSGRFFSEDIMRSILSFGRPLDLIETDHPFVYVYNSPTSMVDPLGFRGLIPTFSDLYRDDHWRRREGHRRYPGERNSSMRHCVTSCETHRGWSAMHPSVPAPGISSTTRTTGYMNELMGWYMHDVPHLIDRIRGRTRWAASPSDLYNNERGISCAGGCPTMDCHTCCSR